MNNNEIWKEIPLSIYEGLYLVSNMGRVFSMRKKRVINVKIEDDLNTTVQLTTNSGHRKTELVSRLTALAFLDREPGMNKVAHTNGITTDNRIENLEWVERI